MPRRRSAAELFRRYLFLAAGLVIMAFGVVFSIIANLGTAPLACPPLVASKIFSVLSPRMTVGVMTIVFYFFCILLQIAVLRKRYQLIQLIQFPVTIFFGYMIDVAMNLVGNIPCDGYMTQLYYCFLGIVLVSIGSSFEAIADVTYIAGDGTMIALGEVTHISFGSMAIIFDTILVAIAAAISIVFFHDCIGIREGTLAAAILTGWFIKLFNKPFLKPLDAFLTSPFGIEDHGDAPSLKVPGHYWGGLPWIPKPDETSLTQG